MRVRGVLVSAATVVAAIPMWGSPAGAAGASLLAEANIVVNADLSACAEVTYAEPTTFVVSMTATGQVSGPGTKLGTVRDAEYRAETRFPTDSWSGCTAGTYSGAAAGSVKYTLVASAVNGGEVVYVVQCTVHAGSVSCV